MKFALQPGLSSREVIAIMNSARRMRHDYEIWPGRPDPAEQLCPIGSVEYCESYWSPETRQEWSHYAIDFYPDFLKEWLHRRVGYAGFGFSPVNLRSDSTVSKSIFLKPAKSWKGEFVSRVVGLDEFVPIDWYYWSDPVSFVQEWRYYVANGRVITTGWYAGNDEDEPAPTLWDVKWPSTYSAAVDFGRLDDGRIALVEAHAPFACGWYGENHDDYVEWQAEAWIYYTHKPDVFIRKDLGRF